MGAFLTAFKSVLGGDPLDGISKIIDAVHPSPEQKAQAQALIIQAQDHADEITAARDAAMEQYQAGVQNDPAWKKAHAYFIYVVDLALFFNLIVIPLWNQFLHAHIDYLPLPNNVMWLFGATFTAFTGFVHGGDLISALKQGGK